MNQPDSAFRRRVLLNLAKVAMVLLVLWFAGGLFQESLEHFSAGDLRPDFRLATLAGLVYLLSLLPMAWFWRRILLALDQPGGWGDVLRAYYLGHLGKYVPGKALVVVLRTGVMRSAGGETKPIAASVFTETLTMMAVGGALGSLLLTFLAREIDQPWLMPLAIGLAVLAAAPTLPPVMQRIIAKLQSGGQPEENGREPPTSSTAGLTWSLLACGWVAALATWVGMSFSLWLTIRGLDTQFSMTTPIALGCLLAVTLPVVAGFLSLLPGGLVVRDGLMLTLLTQIPSLNDDTALAATILLRLIWLMSEATACVMLEIARHFTAHRSANPENL